MSRKVIITCAVTGAIHTPSMSPYLPVTPEEIADAAIGAAEAGAAIVHLHARDPETGQPDQTPEAFAPFLQVIKQRSDCVINLTTGGAPDMTIEERVRPARDLQARGRLAQHGLDEFRPVPDARTGSRSSSTTGSGHPRKQPRPRVPQHLQGHRVHPAHLADSGTRFEFECYDTAHLYNLAHFLERGPGEGRRCSCRPCSASWAASARIPRTCCT